MIADILPQEAKSQTLEQVDILYYEERCRGFREDDRDTLLCGRERQGRPECYKRFQSGGLRGRSPPEYSQGTAVRERSYCPIIRQLGRAHRLDHDLDERRLPVFSGADGTPI